MKKSIALFLALMLTVFTPGPLYAVMSFQDQGSYEGDAVTVNLSTGLSGSLSGSVYTITGGPVGSDGNWTGDGTTTTLDAAPTKFILTHATGDTFSTGFTAGTGDITLENGQTIDGGTDTEVILGDNSDTLAIDFTGDDAAIKPSDGGIIFNTTATDATGTFDFCARGDTSDCLVLDTISNVPTIATNGTSNLSLVPDGGTVAITGILTVSGAQSMTGATTLTSMIIGDDTLDVVVDDQLRFASNDEESTIEAYGFEAKAAVLQLTADEGDDAGDKFQIVSNTSNNLVFTNDTAVKDTHATIMTLSSAGVLTSTGDIIAVNDSATTDAVQDVLQMTSSSTGTAAAGLGAGFTADIENDAGEVEERGSIDIVETDASNGAENADMVVSLSQIGTSREVLRIDTDVTATANTTFELTSWTIETDGVVDVLELKLDNTADTATDGFGMGLSFQLEDETDAVEEQASLDVIVTDAATTAENADLLVRLNQIGTMRDVLRIDTDVTATANTTFELTSWTIETDGVVDMLELILDNTADTATDNFGLGISFQMEDETDAAEEQASLDVVLTDAGSTTEDADIVISQNTAGAIAETFRIVAASSATTGDSFTFTQNTTETDAILDIISLANVTGTATHNAGLGITWDFEDAGGAEEQASLDVQLTTATDTAEDVAIIFSQQTAGAVAETLRIQGASSATTGDSLEFTSNTTETDAVIDIVKLKTATGTAANNSGIGISFEPEDATGSEQQASLDIVLTDATRASADVDFVFSQNIAGAITETLRIDADAAADFGNGPQAKVTGSLYVTQYVGLLYTSATGRPASGAKGGSLVSIFNAADANDCGNTSNGTTFVVCVSDGTNWKSLDIQA